MNDHLRHVLWPAPSRVGTDVYEGALDALEDLVDALERPVTAYGMTTHAAEAYGLDEEHAAAVEVLRRAGRKG